jgi:catechol 2,3-dioxygenase-like lactoylglutathione lyase family enzyme
MLRTSQSYGSFTVDDLDRARAFYVGALELPAAIDGSPNMLVFATGGGTRFMVYVKPDHRPADFTVLNLPVDDIEAVVRGLRARGVAFESLDGTNDDGIAEQGPIRIAWLRDPAGNWLAISEGM